MTKVSLRMPRTVTPLPRDVPSKGQPPLTRLGNITAYAIARMNPSGVRVRVRMKCSVSTNIHRQAAITQQSSQFILD